MTIIQAKGGGCKNSFVNRIVHLKVTGKDLLDQGMA